ncbi:hypothetical protein TWF481_010746 [Arthrobotrys musiformis]|uniref:Uncharacterized protein n=1 Tax=Arthrobotrys musiformis TaxID=47236 RepID=A0AAV9W1S2_9PEZI
MHRCAIAFFENRNLNRNAAIPGETDGQMAIWKPDIDPFCEISPGPLATCCVGNLQTYFRDADRIFSDRDEVEIGSLASDGCTCFVFPTSNNCTGPWSFMMQGSSQLVTIPKDYMQDLRNPRKSENAKKAKSILCYWDKDPAIDRPKANPPPIAIEPTPN